MGLKFLFGQNTEETVNSSGMGQRVNVHRGVGWDSVLFLFFFFFFSFYLSTMLFLNQSAQRFRRSHISKKIDFLVLVLFTLTFIVFKKIYVLIM